VTNLARHSLVRRIMKDKKLAAFTPMIVGARRPA
jgi:hypothetical protein